jgi:hypothetical protein
MTGRELQELFLTYDAGSPLVDSTLARWDHLAAQVVPVSEVEKARADERAKVVSEVVEWLLSDEMLTVPTYAHILALYFQARFAPGTGDDER